MPAHGRLRAAGVACRSSDDRLFGLTAYANDYDFHGVFARQVQALGRRGDVLFGISTSGSSRNVVAAVAEARRAGVAVVTLTGDRGVLSEQADVAIAVPEAVTAHIQEVHLAIEHIICHLVERLVAEER